MRKYEHQIVCIDLITNLHISYLIVNYYHSFVIKPYFLYFLAR